MGLFSSKQTDSGLETFRFALKRFNDIPGSVFAVSATMDEGNLRHCVDAFDRISKLGFPNDPGPFKRLGAFALLSQIWPPFSVRGTIPTSAPTLIEWGPRLSVWALPVFASKMEIEGVGNLIGDLTFPTPHFQVEFIGYLRNMAHGREVTRIVANDTLLLERVTATGLILEACSYASNVHAESALPVQASGCMEAINRDSLLAEDWQFNDQNFLKIAYGMGIED